MRAWIANLIVLAVAGIVFLGIAEVALRLFPQLMPEEARIRMHWQGVGGPDAWFERAVEDPKIGYLYKANDTKTISRGDFSFTYTTDANGFRNEGPPPEHADVVAVGDSMAFGYGVADEEVWTKLIDERNDAFSIYNLGLIGGAPLQYLRILEQYGLPLDPRLVVLVLFPGNDINDEMQFRRWLNEGSGTPFMQWEAEARQDRGILETITNTSYVAAFLRAAMRSLRSDLSNSTITFDDGSRLQLAPTVYQNQARFLEPGNENFALVIASLEQAREVTQQSGAELLVVLMPTKEEIYLPSVGQEAPGFTASFERALSGEGFDVIDLTPELIAVAESEPPLYFEVDGHPNGRGYQIIADIVDEAITERLATNGSNEPKDDP